MTAHRMKASRYGARVGLRSHHQGHRVSQTLPIGPQDIPAWASDSGTPSAASSHRGEIDVKDLETNIRTMGLGVTPLSTEMEATFFSDLYDSYVKPYYGDCEDYANAILDVHRAGNDPLGYFTIKKTIWILSDLSGPIGLTVVTEKRGGSIKFGPTVLVNSQRGFGIGTRLRELVEREYPLARKSYSTIPDDNTAALKYLLRSGCRVEAHLQRQYRDLKGDLAFGKLLVRRSPPPRIEEALRGSGPVRLVDGRDLSFEDLRSGVVTLMSKWYDDIDEGYVRGLAAGMRTPSGRLKKSKRVILAFDSEIPVGMAVVTPKRGGALKCSPLIFPASNIECARRLLGEGEASFRSERTHKVYTHLPVIAPSLVMNCLTLGFQPEGILQEPYKPGVDMVALCRFTR